MSKSGVWSSSRSSQPTTCHGMRSGRAAPDDILDRIEIPVMVGERAEEVAAQKELRHWHGERDTLRAIETRIGSHPERARWATRHVEDGGGADPQIVRRDHQH